MKKTSIFGKLAMGLFAGLCFLTGSNAQNTYVKVTSTEDLEAGGKYLIVCESHSMAMGGQTNTNYRGHVTVSISSNTISTAVAASESDDAPFEITLGGTDGAWTLQDEASDNYLRLNANGNNLHSGDSYEWTISFDQEGNAQINASTFPERFIRYNASSPRFACYRSSSTNMSEVQLYKKQEAAPEAPTVSLQPSSLDLSTTPNEATTGTITITGANLTQDITVALSGDNAGYFSADAETLTATDIMAEGGKTLTITYTPTEAGVHTATLTLSSDDLTNPVTATLNGVAIKEVANLAALYEDYANVNEDQTYTLSGNVVVTHMDSYNERIWVQDANQTDGGSMLLYQCGNVGYDNIHVGDVISGLTGTMLNYYDLLEFLPTENLNVIETGHALYADTVTIADLQNVPDHQSALVCIKNVSFSASGTFETGEDYNLSDGSNAIDFYTNFFGADYIGEAIPEGELHITGIIGYSYNNVKITARSLADFNTPGTIIIPAPTFSPDPSVTYTDSVEVSIACSQSDAEIFYAIDEAEFEAYDQAFVIKSSCSIRAIAVVGEDSSAVASATYTIRESWTPQGDTVLYEPFDGFTAGTLENPSSARIESQLDEYTLIPGWTGAVVYQAGGSAKLGSSSSQGGLCTPALNLDSERPFAVAFKAMAWRNDATNLNVIVNGDTTTVSGLDNSGSYTEANMKPFVLSFGPGQENTTIRFEGIRQSDARFFLDDIRVFYTVKEASLTVPANVEIASLTGQTTTQRVNVKGLFLTEDVNIACPEGNFSVEPATLDADSVMRVNGANFNISYNGALSMDSVTLTLTSGELSETIKVYARAIENTQVDNLAALYDYYDNIDAEEVFSLRGKVVVTHKDDYNSRVWLQDENMENGASILTFRAENYGYADLEVGDVIENLTGTLEVYNNLLEFRPTRTMTASDSNHILFVDTVSVEEINNNILEYQSALVCVKDVVFSTEETTFTGGGNYTLTQGESSLTFRADYHNADYIGQAIPDDTISIIGIVTQYNDDIQLSARSLADFLFPASYIPAPTFSPDPSVPYTDSVEVSIACSRDDADIFYAIDEAGFEPYTQAFILKASSTIRAIAVAGEDSSAVASATYTIREAWVPQGDTVLYEPFDAFTAGDLSNESNPADGEDISSDLDIYTLMPGWTGSRVYQSVGTAKMGSSSAAGVLALPSLDLSGNDGAFAISFRTKAWNNDTTDIHLIVNGDTTTVCGLDNQGNSQANLREYVFFFENGTENTTISFNAAKANGARFFLDDVRVYFAEAPACEAPSNLQSENPGCSPIYVSWEGSAPAYLIALLSADGMDTVFRDTITENSYEFFEQMETETEYGWAVASLCEDGRVLWTKADHNIRLELSNEEMDFFQTRIYPNPSSGLFHIEISNNAKVDVFTANGTLIQSKEWTAGLHEVVLENNGIYFIRISQGGHSTVKRVVVR